MDKYVKYNARATRLALNRSYITAVKEASKVTREDWNIKSGILKKASDINRATNSKLSVQFEMSSKSMNLTNFTTRAGTNNNGYVSVRTPTGKPRKGGGGVKYKLKKKEKTKTLGSSFIKNSKYGGDPTVFTRRPSPTGNSDITAQYSITPSSMFNQEGSEAYIDSFLTMFMKRYKHEVDRLTQ